MSERNRELVDWDEPKSKEQGQSSWSSGAEQMVNEEREKQRDRHSLARPDGSTSQLTEDRVMPEGMDGADEGDIGELDDRGESSSTSRTAGAAHSEGMGGAGGGDLNDMGDVGTPVNDPPDHGVVGAIPDAELDARFNEAWRQAESSSP